MTTELLVRPDIETDATQRESRTLPPATLSVPCGGILSLTQPLPPDLIPMADLTRRGFLASVSATALLTACSSDDGETGLRNSSRSFTDDRGIRVDLPSRPVRIAAYETAAAALINLGVRPVASFGSGPVDQSNPSLAGLDLTGIESVGETYNEINVEKLAALDVHLVITVYDSRDPDFLFGLGEAPLRGQIQAIAPTVALDSPRIRWR